MTNIDIDIKNLALAPPSIKSQLGATYYERRFQGIPGIEITAAGRLYVTFYSGGIGEGPDNFVILVRSDDDGFTWTEPLFTIELPDKARAYDPCLWHDPRGRLWLFWAQSYERFDGRCGVWEIHCSDPDSDKPNWSQPRRIANGIMMNKPTVLSSSEWLLPTSLWPRPDVHKDLLHERYSNVYQSTDDGESFQLLGSADVPERVCDEHMIVERKDGSLWMLVRTRYGIGESISYDGGKSWSPGEPTTLGGPCSRFFIRRLQSGNLLLINHYQFTKRDNLTALLSEDDGATWKGYLLLDERGVTYPDGVQSEDGQIYIVYDHGRRKDKEILMAVFREEDVLTGKCVSPGARLKVIVNKGPE